MPKQFSDLLLWLRGTEHLEAWLLLIDLGRYRLLSDEQVHQDPMLEPVRSLILEGTSAGVTSVTFAEDQRRAAIVARLVSTSLAPPGPGWRVSIPKALDVFVPPETDPRAFSILISLEGYLEIWYTDVLRRAGTLPLEKP